jgi:feruloyl esterase
MPPERAGSCSALEQQKIPADLIGLPSSGATITSTVIVPASPMVANPGRGVVLAIPEYCKVVGHISPVDPGAPDINFQANMPTAWNGKLAQLGGSGQNGVIPVALTTSMQFGPESIPPNAPYALSRGFVTFGSDSGHQTAQGAAATNWMQNQEALTNFLYAQMKKTHDVTVALVKLLYDRPIRHSYYLGASQGGREALLVVQRYPQDYDGVFAQVPVFPYAYLTVFDSLYRARAQAGDSWIPPTKVPVIAAEVRRQCDALDGIQDGLVSNYIACDRRFDPSVTPNPLAAVRCADGKDTGDDCLSDAQIAAVNQVHGPVQLPFPLSKGWASLPGWPTGSESAMNWKTLPSRPDVNGPLTGTLGLIVKDPGVTMASVNPEDYRKQIQEYSDLGDAGDPDLSTFQRRGGKLIMKVNTTDYTADPRWSYAYYEKVIGTMGQEVADRFLRFYVAVGIFHNRNVGRNPLTNELVPSYVDFIAMLDDWVEKGTVPADTQILTDMETSPPFAIKASFPMCRYPMYPRYRGTGDSKNAGSYVCTKP